MRIVTAAEMRKLDEEAIHRIDRQFSPDGECKAPGGAAPSDKFGLSQDKRVHILVGPGNNGGDTCGRPPPPEPGRTAEGVPDSPCGEVFPDCQVNLEVYRRLDGEIVSLTTRSAET